MSSLPPPEYLISERGPRPLGITIFSLLHLVNAVGFIVLAVGLPIWSANKPEVLEGFATFGIPVPLVVANFLFMAALCLGSGIGMWIGARWGWFLGTFYYVYRIIHHLSALLAVFLLSNQLANDELQAGVETYRHYMKFGLRLFVNALFCVYFFKQSVWQYFGFQNNKALKYVLAEFAIGIGIAIAATIVRTGLSN